MRRYADDGLSFLSTVVKQIMSYYPKNLVININIYRVYCNYLDLQLSIDDDVSYETGRVHYRTYRKID